jgi:hypothetical protein
MTCTQLCKRGFRKVSQAGRDRARTPRERERPRTLSRQQMAVPAHWLAPLVSANGRGCVPPRPKRVAKCDSATRESVLLNADLVACILTGNVGVSTFVSARAVCRAWRVACSEDEALLRAVVAYTGSLLKRDFMGLLRLSSSEADAYPRERRVRARGGRYYLYRATAFDMALCDLGGMAGWCVRKSPSPTAHDRCVARRVQFTSRLRA